jgi:hypothetical protein
MRAAGNLKDAIMLDVCKLVEADKIAGLATKIIIFVASALAKHRDHLQPSVGNLQRMCVIWWYYIVIRRGLSPSVHLRANLKETM